MKRSNFSGCSTIDPAVHVAVFGDAGNDVPMFRSIGSSKAKLRVAMPHADDEALNELANERKEVAEVLLSICEAKRLAKDSKTSSA